MLTVDELATFCKKKGFAYKSAEIYGGLAGFFDFGHLGVELKNNIKAELWRCFVQSREDVVGIDGAVITHPKVWEASGHVEGFTDVMLQCSNCKEKFRGDHLIEELLGITADGLSPDQINDIVKKHSLLCPKCKSKLAVATSFNLMFKTTVGSVKEEAQEAYLRPETAQLIFTNFKLVMDSARIKLPFGIAQTGKAFRNEISPRDFLFRTREFEQFEIEFFAHPKKLNECPCFDEISGMKVNILTSEMQKQARKHEKKSLNELVKEKVFKTKWHAYWVGIFYRWFLGYGIKQDKLRIREHNKEELAHYASACFDIEYKFPFGWKEIHGNADRSDFDLQQHIKFSKTDLRVYDEEAKEKVVPCVVSEPSQGIERAMLAFLFEAYEYSKERGNVVLHLHPKLAPVKVGVFPLVNKLDKEARQVYDLLRPHFACVFDRSGSIGRRYARADEIGIPYCITFDFDSLKDDCVTIRDRETTKQERVKISELVSIMKDKFDKTL